MWQTLTLQCGHQLEVSLATTMRRWWCCGGFQEVMDRELVYDILDGYQTDEIWPDATQATAYLRTGKRIVTIQVRDGLL